METNNTPALRFPGFAEEWEEKTLGEVFKTYSGGTPDTTKKKAYYGGTIPFIRSAEINKEETELFLTQEGLEKSSAKLVNKGDLLVALYGANSGDSAIAKINGAINQAVLCLQSENSNVFVQNFLQHNRELITQKYLQGGQGNLSGEIIKSIRVPFPSSKEQQKIAACLVSLDALITEAVKRLEWLQQHKKGLLQQLFPCEGSKTPELRFAGFKGAWEEKTLGDIGEPLMCKRILKEKTTNCCSEGNVPFYKIGTFGQKADAYIPKIIYDEYKGKYSFPKKGEILISASGTIGRLVIYDGEPAYFQDSNIVWVANDQKALLNSFLYYIYTTLKWQTSDGGTINRLYNSDLKRMKVSYPSLPEQQKIASCLSSLDTLIEVQQERITLLKTHKKGLLQQLFPHH
ncbi:MAG: restriction endonuclease subunit S [Bacteroides sp.]